MPPLDKAYLGDGAYVEYDGYSIWLTTEDGYTETNKVCLEPSVLKYFLEYIERVRNMNGKNIEGKNIEEMN